MQLLQGDCLELMKDLPDGCVDMVLCDLPYGTTRNKWDTVSKKIQKFSLPHDAEYLMPPGIYFGAEKRR